jgi:hypothetical protein
MPSGPHPEQLAFYPLSMRQLLAGLSEMELVMGRAWQPNRPLSRHRLKFVPFHSRGPWLQEKAHNSASLMFMIPGPQHRAHVSGLRSNRKMAGETCSRQPNKTETPGCFAQVPAQSGLT